MDKINKILKKIDDVPTLPKKTSIILSIINDPKVHILDIANIIQQDFALSARILKIANSAYYAQNRKIVTILEAIVLLGLETLKELVMAASVYKILSKKIEGYLLEKGDLWHHSSCCALASEIIAKRFRPSLKEEAYIAGLLHDIGKLILAHYIEDEFTKIIDKVEREKVSFDTAEYEIIGLSHAKIGAEILKKWNFPLQIVDAIEYHHSPRGANFKDIASIVHVADISCLTLGIGLGVDGLLYEFDNFAIETLSITKEDSEEIICKVSDAVNSMFNIQQEMI